MLFSKESTDTKPDIEEIYRFDRSEKYFAPGILVRVENGKGDLYETFYKDSYCLMFRDKTLFELQGDEYFCPTCEKLVRTAYNLEQTDEFHMDRINRADSSIDEILEEIRPLLGLLKSGYYCIWDTKLYPTDGNGNLFWDYPKEGKVLPGSCIYYFGDLEWGTLVPHYMIATQPKRKLNMERVDYYRQNPGSRAIAYYMDGNLTALIDGHHKAMAAAMEHKECNALVITRCSEGTHVTEKGIHHDLLIAGDSSFDMKELGIKLIKQNVQQKNVPADVKEITEASFERDDAFPCEIDSKELARYYPTVRLGVSIDLIGGDIDDAISKFLNNEKAFTFSESEILLAAAMGLHCENAMDVADKILREAWDADTMLMALEYVLMLPHTDELEQYLIDYMVEVEGDHPNVGRYIMQNLW